MATSLTGRDCRLDLSRPAIMGILNVTPDSFSDGGRFQGIDAAVRQAVMMQEEGAALLDIGGESTRPGAVPVSAAEEIERVVPVIERLRCEVDLPLSVDTTKAAVAREAIAAGANFVNDISGLRFDTEIATVVAETGAGLFLMHTRGRPQEMQQQTDYADLPTEVVAGLERSLALALAAGVPLERLSVDPGIGFAKSVTGNLELLQQLERLHCFACPVLLGTSRKSFIGAILGQDNPVDRLAGTLATVALAVAKGVQIFRVHDVAAAYQAAIVAWSIRESRLP
jgi:dihydropteroate synthase